MPRTLLLDGDTVVYEACRGNEVETRWENELWTLHCDARSATEQFQYDVEHLRRVYDADRVIIALSDYDSPRWRNEVMPSYKAARLDIRKPVAFRPVREYAQANFETMMKPGLEGDDVLGILMTKPRWIGERILVSIDKDMKTLPGTHVNYHRLRETSPAEALFEVSVDQANAFHMYQTLSGDRVDGYPGCPSIGDVRAERMLQEAWNNDRFDVRLAWQIVIAAYRKAGLGEEVAMQNAQVARILRWKEWDAKQQKPILWTPPKER